MNKETCLLCNEYKLIDGGAHYYDESIGHIFRCKECSMKDMRCLDCYNSWQADLCLIFDNGDGDYSCLCKSCLDKSYILLRQLKNKDMNECFNLIENGYQLIDDGFDEKYKEKLKTRRERLKDSLLISESLKEDIINAFDIIFSITCNDIIVEGRDKCLEYLKLETSDYKYEFKIGCHNNKCNYISIFIDHDNIRFDFHSSYDIIKFWVNGNSYFDLPCWIPLSELKTHCESMIQKLNIPTCNKNH